MVPYKSTSGTGEKEFLMKTCPLSPTNFTVEGTAGMKTVPDWDFIL